MCGRFANDAETNELIEEFVASGGDYRDWIPRFSIAPTEVVRLSDRIVVMRDRRKAGELPGGSDEQAIVDLIAAT